MTMENVFWFDTNRFFAILTSGKMEAPTNGRPDGLRGERVVAGGEDDLVDERPDELLGG